MKFYVKVFFSMLLLASLSFGVFGTLMIQEFFQSALNREIEMGKSENQMLKLTFETTVNSMPEAFNEQGNNVWIEVAQSINRRMDSEEDSMLLVSSEGGVIYSGGAGKADTVLLEQISLEESGYRIYEDGEKYYLNVMSVIDSRLTQNPVCLETVRDISHIYSERSQMLYTYRTIMLVMLAVVAVLALVISFCSQAL